MPITDMIYDNIHSSGASININSAPVYDRMLSGTFSGFTIGSGITQGVLLEIEPDTTISTATVIQGSNITLWCRGCLTVSGLLTMSGDNNSVICGNGSSFSGLKFDGSLCYFNGGGSDTLVNGALANHGIEISSSAQDNVAENFAIQTTGSTAFNAIDIQGDNNKVFKFIVNDSGDECCVISGDNNLLSGFITKGSDNDSIVINGGSNNIITLFNVKDMDGSNGINLTGDSDCNIVTAGINQFATSIGGSCDSNIVSGNRIVSAVSDSGVDSISGNNDVGAI